ncbi:MAG: glycosyl hydrolase family protein [Gammaproteobacteria bacterium]|nr:MAG: glycosyl hydrolase family protein [Gammaproteobacteria bacterium]
MAFPANFLWGCSTSAHQIEGSPLADGAAPSIWQRFAHTPGLVRDGDTGDVACDHYRRYRDDVALMAGLGVKSYRFSISWSRVLPGGTGTVNPAGLGFYDRLTDELLKRGIAPMATLYHWDLPAALDDRGGWLNPDAAAWFAEYAAVLFRKLDGRVKLWATLNEPWVVADGGYLHGVLLEPKHAASSLPEDAAATQRADAYMNRQYLDPVFFGSYPPELEEIFGSAWPRWPEADFDLIKQRLDFLGVNYYTRSVIRADATVRPVRAAAVRQRRATYTETGWEVYPKGLSDILLWVRQRYGTVPLYVTENGAAFFDPPTVAGDSHEDPLRVAYLREHLQAARAATEQGVDLRGYFVWSLLDNFEWALGYSKRFGIVHVDFETQRRVLKASARFYSKVIADNGATLDAPISP